MSSLFADHYLLCLPLAIGSFSVDIALSTPASPQVIDQLGILRKEVVVSDLLILPGEEPPLLWLQIELLSCLVQCCLSIIRLDVTCFS